MVQVREGNRVGRVAAIDTEGIRCGVDLCPKPKGLQLKSAAANKRSILVGEFVL